MYLNLVYFEKFIMAKKGKKLKVSDESVNTYGTRVLTAGWMNRKKFEDNPLMLLNHARPSDGVLPIGTWTDIEVKNKEIHMSPVFDDEDEGLGKQVAGKYERNVMRAASVGIRILETSDKEEDLLPGQTRPTITKWELREVSLVDIPANANCISFYDEAGAIVNFSDTDQSGVLPILNHNDENIMSPELKKQLGLKDDATDAEVTAAIANLKSRNEELEIQFADRKKKEKANQDAEVVKILNAAVTDGKIQEAERGIYKDLFEANFAATKKVMAGLGKRMTLSGYAKGKGSTTTVADGKVMTFSDMRKEQPEKLAKMKEDNFAEFNDLYKAEFGKDFIK